MDIELECGGKRHHLKVERTENGYRVHTGARSTEYQCHLVSPGTRVLLEGQVPRLVHFVKTDGAYHVFVAGETFLLSPPLPSSRQESTRQGAVSRAGQICAPMPGRLLKLLAREGQRVAPGDRLAIVEAMKMEHEVRSPVAGIIRKVNFPEDTLVDTGQPLVEIEVDEAPLGEAQPSTQNGKSGISRR